MKRSLPEVHSSVTIGSPSLWKRMFAFAGPAYLVSVGYMDPGNWATDLEGGARFGYELMWVLVMSNAMAILLQTLSARLGIVSRRDLAQACRETYPKPVSRALWALCEVAIAACDLAEILGAAIGFNLLFKIPLLAGVAITACDTLLILWFTKFGIRIIESIVLSLITIIAGCFAVVIFLVKPDAGQILAGLIPRLNDQSLYIAIGILGATVMPHNLYLHSSLVQTRRIGATDLDKRAACRFNLIDSVVALNGALFVNAAILILAAALFFQRGLVVTEIQQAHLLLEPLVGTTLAGILFAVALLAAGQSSTITGTMAGQIVMEGFLNFRMRPWLRRFLTRMVAVIPAAATIYVAGEAGAYKLLILSQVILSLQLPFAVIPLIHLTSDRRRMGAFANPNWVRWLAWTVAAVIVGLNLRLAWTQLAEWHRSIGPWLMLVTVPLAAGLGILLGWVTIEPWLPARIRRLGRPPVVLPSGAEIVLPRYKTILVPLDHTAQDVKAVSHAAALARLHGARLHLLHVEEGVTSQVYGAEASTEEVEAGQEYLNGIAASLHEQGVEAGYSVVHSADPARAIVRGAREIRPGVGVMGAHGHKGFADIIFGTTIDGVRHDLGLPVLIVRQDG
ncbi:MAG: Nramp family divalent metal transporter [Acidobacteria bacterium]|nr:Nramp family divalent metal transporter [Acidobacteriota bacterium]